jgi:hypothetical protein
MEGWAGLDITQKRARPAKHSENYQFLFVKDIALIE